jgi:LmbE family N-acetylglucosaminyl deacetylase
MHIQVFQSDFLPIFVRKLGHYSAHINLSITINYGDKMKISAVVPARNEEKSLGGVLSALSSSPELDEIIVVDNGSTDNTASVASKFTSRVIYEPEPGFGRAMKRGFKEARNDWIFKIDADIRNPSGTWVSRFKRAIDDSTRLIKGYWSTNSWPRPVTTLVAKPMIKKLIPELARIRLPLSGIYLANKTIVKPDELRDDWAFDLQILINCHNKKHTIKQVRLPEIVDTRRPLDSYIEMASDLMSFMLDTVKQDKKKPETLMLIVGHPDDAEIWCGGTIAKYCLAGSKVVVVIATSNKKREREAKSIQKLFKNIELIFLEKEEFSPFSDPEVTEIVAGLMSEYRPDIIITHHHEDPHADHRCCYVLTTSAILKLRRSWVPRRLLLCNGYYQTLGTGAYFIPDCFIDISDEYKLKEEIVRNHRSQQPEYWLQMTDLLDRLNGMRSGVQRAEAYQSSTFYMCPKALRSF